MEGHLVQTILADPAIAEIVGDRFYASGSLGEGPNPAQPQKPWMAWTELPSAPYREVQKTSNSQLRLFQIFVYDDKGDYERINRILSICRRIVKSMYPFETEDGVRCSGSEWGGFSGNIVDDGYDASVRFGIARFTVSE